MLKKLMILLILFGLPMSVFATDYQMFANDAKKATNYWKQSVALTSRKDKEKTIQVLNGFIKEWRAIILKYKNDVPKEFTDKAAFQNMLTESLTVAEEALALTQKGKLKKAHDVVEKIRYLIWELRAEAQIFPLIDDLNAFHEIMEIVIEQAEMSETPEEFSTIVNRHGYWMKTKWFEIGYKIDTTTKNPELKAYFNEGKKAIDIFMMGAVKADIDMVDPAAHKIKKNFKKLFFSPDIY